MVHHILLSSLGLCRYHYATEASKLQNRAMRVASNSCFEALSEPLLQELGCLTIEQLIELETVKVVYKALHNEAPPHTKKLLFKLSDPQSKELRNFSTDLYIRSLIPLWVKRASNIEARVSGATK